MTIRAVHDHEVSVRDLRNQGDPLYTFNADDLRGVSGLEIVALPRDEAQ